MPTNLTATPAAPTQVNLAWNPATDNVAVVGYQIYRNGIRIATLVLTSYADTSVAAVTWYTYAVAATDAAGNASAQSVVANVLTPPPTDETAPAISAAAVAAVTQNAAAITWQTNELAVSSVEYGLSTSYGLSSPWSAIFATAHTASITGLSPGNTYHYRLIARDTSGNLARSQDFTLRTASAEIPDLAPPPAVSDLAIADVQQTSLVLSWTLPADESGVRSFDIRYATVPLTPQNFSAATRVQTTAVPVPLGSRQSHYVSVGLTPGVTYYFALTATDGAGNVSPLSNVPQATMRPAPTTESPTPSTEPGTLSIPIRSEDGIVIIGYTIYQLDDATAPTAPRQVVGQGTDAQVTLRWVNPTDPDFVRVQIHRSEITTAPAPTGGIIVYEGRDETFTDLSAVNGVTYTYRLSAFDRSGNFAPPVYVEVAARSGVTQADAPVVAGVGGGGKRLAWLVVGKVRRQLYIIFADGRRRLIGSLSLAEQLGIPVGNATVVDEQALEAYPLGPPLTAADTNVREVLDSDGDSLADAVEDRLGTDPTHPDTDRDLTPDGRELSDGTDPRFPPPAGLVPPDLAARAAGRFAVAAGGEHPVYYFTPGVVVRLPIPDEAAAWQVVTRRSLRIPHHVVQRLTRAGDRTAAPAPDQRLSRLEGRIIIDASDGRAWYVRTQTRFALPPDRLPERMAALAEVFPAADVARIPYRWLGP